ncbi:MAG: hypothetical protein AABX32_00680, partial [Nanoarchaeota archaeon]
NNYQISTKRCGALARSSLRLGDFFERWKAKHPDKPVSGMMLIEPGLRLDTLLREEIIPASVDAKFPLLFRLNKSGTYKFQLMPKNSYEPPPEFPGGQGSNF